MTCPCGADALVTCSTCHRGFCVTHIAAASERCPNCDFPWIQVLDHDAALRAVRDRTAASGGPPGDGSSSLLSWALVVAVRLGCSPDEISEATARGRALRERRRVRLLEKAAG